jgi:hypothetical protein
MPCCSSIFLWLAPGKRQGKNSIPRKNRLTVPTCQGTSPKGLPAARHYSADRPSRPINKRKPSVTLISFKSKRRYVVGSCRYSITQLTYENPKKNKLRQTTFRYYCRCHLCGRLSHQPGKHTEMAAQTYRQSEAIVRPGDPALK